MNQRNHRPLVSIIIPMWNTGEGVIKLLESLVKQKYRPLEIIVVNDGSTDNSLADVEKVAKRLRGQRQLTIQVSSQRNAGAAAARNFGINISHGEYLIFIDSDDAIDPEFVNGLVKAVTTQQDGSSQEYPLLAVTGEQYRRLATGFKKDVFTKKRRARHNREKIGDYILYLMLLDGRMYGAINKIFRGDVIRKGNIKFQTGRDFAEDTKFVLDYIAADQTYRQQIYGEKYSPGDIIFLLKPWYIYNFGTTTSTVKESATKWSNWEMSYRDLSNWAREISGLGIKTRILLFGIRCRWRISHRRSIRRAKEIDNIRKTDVDGATNKPAPRVEKFIGVGIVVTLLDFLLCTLLTRVVFHNNQYQALAAAIAMLITTVIAYFLHSHFTWRDRKPAEYGIAKFFAWNISVALILRPAVTWMFGLLTGLYQFVFMITSWLKLPFDFDTVEYLGVYALTTVITMTLNFFFYDLLVFGKKRPRH